MPTQAAGLPDSTAGVHTEQVHGELVPDPSWTLSASEIGAFAFCPQAWYLQRRRELVTAEAALRREIGSRAHRQIGGQTNLVRGAQVAQWLLLVAMAVALVLLAALLIRVLPRLPNSCLPFWCRPRWRVSSSHAGAGSAEGRSASGTATSSPPTIPSSTRPRSALSCLGWSDAAITC